LTFMELLLAKSGWWGSSHKHWFRFWGPRHSRPMVRTTAELVIGLLPEWRFRRELDPATGYAELEIKAQPDL